MKFATKIAIAVREDLATWQKLNMTAFLASGIASTGEVIGAEHVDGSGRRYRPMFRQPIMVLAGSGEALRGAYERAQARGLAMAIFTDPLFGTGHDEANRAAVAGGAAGANGHRGLCGARPPQRRRPRAQGADAAPLRHGDQITGSSGANRPPRSSISITQRSGSRLRWRWI